MHSPFFRYFGGSNEMTLTYALRNNYNKYSKFKTIEDFNNDFNKAMYYYKDKFTKSEYIALKKLSKFAFSEKSPNTIGIAWSKGQIVVAATHKERKCENETFGISRSTFDRMLRKAKKLNLIRVINQFHKNRKQKHNLYVFNRFEELTPEKFEIVSENNTIEVSKTINKPITLLLELPKLKELNNTYQQAENVGVDKVGDKDVKGVKEPEPKTDYQRVTKKISGLFKDKSMTYRIYGVWLAQSKKTPNKPPIKLALEALHILIAEIKRRVACEMKPLRNPVGFFSGILKNLLDEYYEKRFEEGFFELHTIEDEINNNYIQCYNP